MTVFTKPSINARKPDVTILPLVLDTSVDEEKKDKGGVAEYVDKQSVPAVLFMTIISIVLMAVGVSSGLLLYQNYLRSTHLRYQRFCAVPLKAEPKPSEEGILIEPNYHMMMPLQWSLEPDVQIFSSGSNDISVDIVDALLEGLELRDTVEKISVFDNGRQISFIHDFDSNITGIVDEDRCFMSDLDMSLVMPPQLFVAGIERGEQWDVSRVRSSLKAIFPALSDLMQYTKALAVECADKPTYRLKGDNTTQIRKRSADAPPHDYIQFSGKHVQEIEITNLGELLEYEQGLKQAAAA